MYWQLLGLAAVVFLVGWLIGRSRLGFALRIIGNDEVVAVHCGINTARAKVILFVISSTFAVDYRRAGGAALELRRAVDRVQPVPVVPGRDHGAAGRRSPAVGAAGRRHSVHAAVGVHLGQISQRRPRCSLGACFLLIVYFIPSGVVGLLEDPMRGHVGGVGAHVKGLSVSAGRADNA